MVKKLTKNLLLLVFLVGLVLYLTGLFTLEGASWQTGIYHLVTLLVAFVLWGIWKWKSPGFRARWNRIFASHGESLDSLTEKSLGWWIFLASALGLYIELMLIRWHAVNFQLFAYFKNISLLAAFLGLGIGFFLAKRQKVKTFLVVPALSLQFLILFLLHSSSLQQELQNPVSEELALGLAKLESLSHASLCYGFLILVFTFTVLTCIPLGHLISRLMKRKNPLAAYSWNLLGSLFGIGVFYLLAFFWTPPLLWLIIAFVGLLPFLYLHDNIKVPALAGLMIAATVFVLFIPQNLNRITVYSPYQILSLELNPKTPPALEVNHVYYQSVKTTIRKWGKRSKKEEAYFQHYELPYQIKKEADKIAIVGSGMGNDAAAALRYGVKEIHAVEIDPAIYEFGRLYHPEEPYQNPKVKTVIKDARDYLRWTDEKYDMIIYGLLDSHTLLASHSNVRLDSYVYTLEAMREAQERLTSDGVLMLSFTILSAEQGKKFYRLLKEAFGEEPKVYQSTDQYIYIFIAGPGISEIKPAEELSIREATSFFRNLPGEVEVATDNWPFPYMPFRQYPLSYLIMIGIFLAISLVILQHYRKGQKKSFSGACFFLGAGFMLVETKGITEAALSFGSTWQVIGFVIGGVLIMAWLANLIILRFGSPPKLLAYGLLFASLLLGMYFSTSALGLSSEGEKALRLFLVTLPLFFSGFAFSMELKNYGEVAGALSSNLFGAMLGGFMEYNSMYFGFDSLYLFAIAFYILALVFSLKGGK